MKITIRGKRVKTKLISKSLSNTEIDSYKPTWLPKPLKITFGFTCEKTQTDDYGMLLYHRNRLIKPFEKVGYQKQPNDLGIGVVGVAQVDCLQATHNKQDFIKDEKFNSIMASFANKLNDYWNEKKQHDDAVPSEPNQRAAPDWLWAQCDQCLKWRRLPDGYHANDLPERWFCYLNFDPTHNRCEIPEEPEDEDLAVRPSYVKTFKKKKEEQRRQELMNMRQQGLSPNEADLLRRAGVKSQIVENPLQKELDEAKQREIQYQQFIRTMEEEKKALEVQKNSLATLAQSLEVSKGRNYKNIVEKVSQMIGFKFAHAAGTSTTLSQQNSQKRKQDSTPEYIRNKRPAMNIQSNHGNNSRNNSSHSTPLRLNVGGLVKNTDDQANAKLNNSFKSATPSIKNAKDAVEVTGSVDYEVTINEDYNSDESNPSKKTLTFAEREREKREQEKKKKEKNKGDKENSKKALEDVKPDKTKLDKKIEESKTADKQPGVEGTIKQELPDKQASQINANSNSSSPAPDSDSSLPSSDMVPSNVNKVMAAIDKLNNLKQLNPKSNDISKSDSDTIEKDNKKAKSRVKNRSKSSVSKNSDGVEIVEIFSDDSDDDLEVLDNATFNSVIKKEPTEIEDKSLAEDGKDVANSCLDGKNSANNISKRKEIVEKGDKVDENVTNAICNNEDENMCDMNDDADDEMNWENNECNSVQDKEKGGSSRLMDDNCENGSNGEVVAKSTSSVHSDMLDNDSRDHEGSVNKSGNSDVVESDHSKEKSSQGNAKLDSSKVKDGAVVEESDNVENNVRSDLQESSSVKFDGCGVTNVEMKDLEKSKNEGDQISENTNGKKLDRELVEEMEVDNDEVIDNTVKLKPKHLSEENNGLNNKSTNCGTLPNNGIDDEKASNVSNKKCLDTQSSPLPSSNQQPSQSNDSKESQTDSFLIDDLVIGVKNELLEENRQLFQNFKEDVHHLLTLLCPSASIGGVKDTVKTVKEMIEVHLDGSQSQATQQNDNPS